MDSTVVIVLVGVAAAVACSLAGIFLVLRRLAMVADAITHAILPGLVGAYFLAQGPNFAYGLVGGIAAGLLTVVLVELLLRSGRFRQDAAIGIVFPAMFALGVFLVVRHFENVHLDADAILYGEIAYAPFDTWQVAGRDLGPQSLWILGFLTLLNAGVLTVFYKELKISTFDAALAASLGLIPGVMHYLLMSLVAATTVGALGAVGAILALGLIVIPPVTAHLLTDRLAPLIALTLVVAVVGSLGGVWLAYALNVSISGMIATVLGALCLSAVAFSPSKGVVVMQRKRLRQRRDFAIETLVVHLETHRETEEELEESRVGHLSQELKWPPEFAERVVREAERRQVVRRTGERLELTEAGKVAAEQSNDPSAAASPGSPRRSP